MFIVDSKPKYITDLHMINFLSHKNTSMKFCDGMNSIIGSSESGKSVIWRCLYWVFYNQPLGLEDVLRQGTSKVVAKVKFSDGYTIIKTKSKTINQYEVVNPEGQKRVFRGFGSKVPIEVTEAHGMPLINLDNNVTKSLNMLEQDEPPTLIYDSGPLRAKVIGMLGGAQIIDLAMKNLNSKIDKANTDKKYAEGNISALTKKLEQFDGLDEEKESLNRSEELHKKLININGVKHRIQSLSNTRKEVDRKVSELKVVIENLSYIKEASKICMSARKLAERLLRVTSLYNHKKELLLSVTMVEKFLSDVDYVDHAKEISKGLASIAPRYSKIKSIKIERDACLGKKRDTEAFLDACKNLDECEDNLIKLKNKAFKFNKVCSNNAKRKTLKENILSLQEILIQSDYVGEAAKLNDSLKSKTLKTNKIAALEEKRSALSSRIAKGNEHVQKLDNKIRGVVLQYKDAIKQFEACPLCYSELDESKVENIINKIGGV